MSKKVAIGIDLGTTYSCVGVFRNGKVEIIINEKGSRITPSCVAFTSQERLVGDSAKAQGSVNSKNTVFEAKRLIGRRFADATVQKDLKLWPFEVFDDNGAPMIRVHFMKEEKTISPEEISAMVLKKLKTIAETKLGEEVQDAVITVPAYFNDSQRQATIDAGKIAGLNVLSIINEPTAAALAYGFEDKALIDQNILVFDLGGGTFDVVILAIKGKNYEVKAVSGDTHLGGGDFDSRLVDHCLKIIHRKYGKDLSLDHKALGRLRKSCEDVKISLSGLISAGIDIACLFDGVDFQVKVTRKRFEELCSDLFKTTVELVKSVLEDAGMNKCDIHEVILVGGSSRIPKIQELLREFFSGKKLNATINPDEAVAYGAAVKAALDSGEHTMEDITMTDVVPISLGVSDASGLMQTFIKRNTRIPTTVVQTHWTTSEDYQTAVLIKVYEGERNLASSNHLLGTFHINIGEREKQGVPKLTYTCEVDANGILHVSCVNKKTKCSAGLTITNNKGRLTKESIERMVQESRQHEFGARTQEDAGPSKEALETYCLDQKERARLKCEAGGLSVTGRDLVMGWCDEALNWLDYNDNLRKGNYDLKFQMLKSKCSEVFVQS